MEIFNLLRSYVWSRGEVLLMNAGGNTYQVGYDANQNVGVLIKAGTGTVSASYDYDPFGQTLKAIGEYASQNAFRFSNQYTDTESGFTYYGYRYYNSQTGRWISRDPVAEEGGLNLYGLVGNDVINAVDYLGLWKRPKDWSGRRGKYSGTAIAECPDESLRTLAFLITGNPSDSSLLGAIGKIERDQAVDISPLLSKFEQRLRDSVVVATRKLNTGFPRVVRGQLQIAEVTIAASETAAINRYFRPKRFRPYQFRDCLIAVYTVYAKGLVDVLRRNEFDALNFQEQSLPFDDPINGRVEEMMRGDYAYFSNYDDYLTKVPSGAYQAENVIKTGPDRYWGHPSGEKSLLGWYQTLRDEFNRPGGRRFGEQRNSQVPGFDGKINFLDVARISMAVFDFRRNQQH